MKICVLTGVYPPDSGGPARFATTFPGWVEKNSLNKIEVLSFTNKKDSTFQNLSIKINLISRQTFLPIRIKKTVSKILKIAHEDTIFIANGMFLEILISKFLRQRISYVAKVPGDVVWERSKNKGRTSLNMRQFQNHKLNWRDRVNREIFTLSLKKAEKIIVPSMELFYILQEWGINSDKIAFVGNAANEQHFRIIDSRQDIDILCVSRLVSWKNIDEVIKVAKSLDKNITIAGEGEEKLNLIKLAEQLDVNAKFVGNVDYQELPKLYNRAVLYVLNSDYEGMPYSLIEAQLCGVFSIANGNTGSSEVIINGVSGRLTNSSEFKELLNAVSVYFQNEIGKFDRERIHNLAKERFGYETNFRKILDVIEALE